MVFLSATCIGGFYATSLVWGQHTHYSMIEYWRWWLVHLWVEGFFEVFATAVVALIFTRLGLVRAESANRAIVAETIVFLFGGILGTLHHLYLTGTPTSVIAVGAVFSALEVVPLALIGLEALQTYRRSQSLPWLGAYKWVVLCFVAVGFWNTVGAGLLGFAINPPASLYYVQGLNMTAAHGHAALFGVYGMLGIGLMLFCLRGLYARNLHADSLLKPAFWGLNIGLAMMVFLSLLPAGIYQAWASVSKGLWYARSAEVIHSKVMETLVWLRVPGDIVFAVGAVFLAIYALRLLRGRPATQRTPGPSRPRWARNERRGRPTGRPFHFGQTINRRLTPWHIPIFDAVHPFDARGVAKRFRHAAIFGALRSLNAGETMRFVNDHDPLAAARATAASLRRSIGYPLRPSRAGRNRDRFPGARLTRLTPFFTMKLTAFTDYSLRVLIYLARSPRAGRPSPRSRQAFDVSEHHLTKVVHCLGKDGWLANVRGKGGGLELAMPPELIVRRPGRARDRGRRRCSPSASARTRSDCSIASHLPAARRARRSGQGLLRGARPLHAGRPGAQPPVARPRCCSSICRCAHRLPGRRHEDPGRFRRRPDGGQAAVSLRRPGGAAPADPGRAHQGGRPGSRDEHRRRRAGLRRRPWMPSKVHVLITMTSAACPVTDVIVEDVETRAGPHRAARAAGARRAGLGPALDHGAHERAGPPLHGLVMARPRSFAARRGSLARGAWRRGPSFLVLVAVALLAGIAGGLLRVGCRDPGHRATRAWLGQAGLAHAALMVCAFLGHRDRPRARGRREAAGGLPGAAGVGAWAGCACWPASAGAGALAHGRRRRSSSSG